MVSDGEIEGVLTVKRTVFAAWLHGGRRGLIKIVLIRILIHSQ